LIRKIARISRVTIAVIALLGLVALSVIGLFGEKVLRAQVESQLTRALGREVRVGSLSVNLPRRTVELRDTVIKGRPDSKRDTLVAPTIRVALSFRSLLTSKILLRGLELDRPRMSIQVFEDGSTDLPRSTPSNPGASRQVSIGRVAVTGGAFFLNDQQIPLELDWPNFEASLQADAANLLAGNLRAGPGPMRFGVLPAQDARFEAGVRLADSTLHVDRGEFTASSTRLNFAGHIDLHNEPRGELGFEGPFDLESFDQKISGAGLDLTGVAQTKASLTLGNSGFVLNGTLRGQKGSYASLPIDVFSTTFSWDGSRVRLADLSLEALSGRALLEVDAPQDDPVKLRGSLEGLSAEPLLGWLFDYGTAGLGARVSGPIDLSFPRGAANLLSGTGDLTFVGDPALGESLSGRFPFQAERGAVTIAAAKLDVPDTEVTLAGSIQPDKRLSLDLRLASEDLARTDALAVRLRGALGMKEAEPLGATGRGGFEGRVTGTMSAPLATGRFTGTGVSYLGVLWGDLDWTGSASAVDLMSEHLVAVRGASRAEMKGTQRLGATGIDDAMDLNVTLKDWKAADLLKVIASDLDVDTEVSGSLRLLGTRAKPLGNASLKSGAGKAMGVAYTKADLGILFEGEALRIERLAASVGGGTFALKGVLGEQAGLQAFDGDVDFKEVELADLGLQTESAAVIGGRITGRATLGGPMERPRVEARLDSRRIFYGDEGIGALSLDVRGAGDGLLHLAGSSDSPRFRAEVTGAIEAKAPYVSRLEIKLTNARIDPVLRALGSRFENLVAITASANARVFGPLQDPDSMTAQLRDGKLRVAVPDYAIEAAPGAIIDVEKGEIRIAGLTLQGDGTALNVSGKLAMREDDQNDLSVTGRADLRVLSGFFREWRFRGAATLRSQIGGTPGAIRVSGGLDIEDGSLRLRTFPQGLDALNGRLVFNETQARVASLEGRFGGGRVTVSGQMGFGGAVPASFDFLMNGTSLGLRYPEGLRSTFDGAVRLQGTTQAHWLTGNLVVSKAHWTRKYTITSELLGSQGAVAGFARGPASFNPSPMRLDIAIKAPATLRLDNNLAELLASADLTLTGSPVEPQLLGRVEIEQGKVFFRGNTYEVRKGVAHFSNPRQINPVFDIEADTRVRSHRLTLQANGTLDRVSTRITSDPPLTAPQIASLLTGGDENDIEKVSGSVTDFKTLGRGGVNSFAASVLDDAITGKVAQGVGLSRLSIDPGNKGFLSRTGMRLTVGIPVARDLEVVYSQVFGGTESQLVTAEYSLTNRFSLILSWEERLGYGADARTRFVLGRK
jgi:TamB, inner membrane protein subunit of TAM complex